MTQKPISPCTYANPQRAPGMERTHNWCPGSARRVQAQKFPADRRPGVLSTHNLCTKEGAATVRLAPHGARGSWWHTKTVDTASIGGVCCGVQEEEQSRREGERADSIRRLNPIKCTTRSKWPSRSTQNKHTIPWENGTERRGTTKKQTHADVEAQRE